MSNDYIQIYLDFYIWFFDSLCNKTAGGMQLNKVPVNCAQIKHCNKTEIIILSCSALA